MAYDRETHALIRDMPRSSRASNMPEVEQNPDGSVDVWFGPESPEGKESNWIPTKADGRFELVFRFYGPEPPLFEKTWVLRISRRLNDEESGLANLAGPTRAAGSTAIPGSTLMRKAQMRVRRRMLRTLTGSVPL